MRIQRPAAYKAVMGGSFGTKAVTLSDVDNFMDWLVSLTYRGSPV